MASDVEPNETTQVADVDASEPKPRRSRRSILAAAVGGVAGLVAAQFSRPDPAAAAAGDPIILAGRHA